MARVADRNIGFKGTVTTDDWAELARYMGVQYAVGAPSSLVASRGTGDRVVKVSAGTAFGDGVLSIFVTETNDVTLAGEPVIGTGSRWDTLMVVRRWTPENPDQTGTSTLELRKGTAAKAVAPVEFGEQPLWLVRFQAGSSVAQEFVDLRTFVGNGGGLLARDEMALQYLLSPGTHVTLAGGPNGEGRTWYRALDANGNAVWEEASPRYHRHHILDIEGISNPVTANAAGLQVRAASWAGKNSTSGGMTLRFDAPFPSTCLAVVVTNGAGDSVSFWPEVVSKDRTGFSYRIRDANGVALKDIQHRVDYIAIGI